MVLAMAIASCTSKTTTETKATDSTAVKKADTCCVDTTKRK